MPYGAGLKGWVAHGSSVGAGCRDHNRSTQLGVTGEALGDDMLWAAGIYLFKSTYISHKITKCLSTASH